MKPTEMGLSRIVTARCRSCGALAKAWFYPDDAASIAEIAGMRSEPLLVIGDEYGSIIAWTVMVSRCPDCLEIMEASRVS